MNEFLFAAFAVLLIIALLCYLLILAVLVYKGWKDFGYGVSIFYVLMLVVTALSYWCLALKAADIIRGVFP